MNAEQNIFDDIELAPEAIAEWTFFLKRAAAEIGASDEEIVAADEEARLDDEGNLVLQTTLQGHLVGLKLKPEQWRRVGGVN